MNDALAAFFHHNLWANLRLLDVCAGLADDDLDARADGTYGTVRNTLMHIFSAEDRYVASLITGDIANAQLNETQPFPGVEALRPHAERTGAALVGVAEAWKTGAEVSGTYRGSPFTMPVATILTQAVNHATEHRAHISTILTARGATVPSMDVWTYAGRP